MLIPIRFALCKCLFSLGLHYLYAHSYQDSGLKEKERKGKEIVIITQIFFLRRHVQHTLQERKWLVFWRLTLLYVRGSYLLLNYYSNTPPQNVVLGQTSVKK